MKNTFIEKLARCAYSWLWRLALPLYLCKLQRRGRKEPLYAQHIGERFGFYSVHPPHKGSYIWLHAVSLGETRAAGVLIEALRKQLPDVRLLLTSSTATGRSKAKTLLRPGDIQCWLPVDTPGGIKRFLRHYQPVLGLLMETEIWPNVMHYTLKQGVPMFLINGRLSEKSLRGVRQAAVLLEPAYKALAGVLAQTQEDAQRLEQAGASKVLVMGNLKYDMQPDPALAATGQTIKTHLQRPVVMAASTRHGEEALLLDEWKRKITIHGCTNRGIATVCPLLLLVPRHPQRFDEVEQLIKARSLRMQRRSCWGKTFAPKPGCTSNLNDIDVLLGDSLGEMALYYCMSDVVLLGGSFEPFGGQNLLEALACGCPVVMGQHTYNFSDSCAKAIDAGVAFRAKHFDDALIIVKRYLHEEPNRQLKQRTDAQHFVTLYAGASKRMATYIANEFSIYTAKNNEKPYPSITYNPNKR